MTPLLHKHIPHPCQPQLATVRRFPNRKWYLIPLAGLVIALALASCSETASDPPPPPVAVTDTEPVGRGLTVIGFSLLAAALVGVFGRMLK